MKLNAVWVLSGMALALPSFSNAAVSLIDKDDWKVQMSGFVELDAIADTRRSLTEVEGNTAIDRLNTKEGSNGRAQMSIRNSRLAFSVLPPVQDDWKTKGYLEFDLLGYDPGVSSSGTTNSEAGFYNNPSLRVRHAYLSAENNGWSLLAGQYWSLFGWQPTYVLSTASVPPAPGALYERIQQVTAMKTIALGEKTSLVAAVSVARPAQRDSSTPNLDAGVKLSCSERSSAFAAYNTDVIAQPASLALSGTLRQFETPYDAVGTAGGQSHFTGSAFAVDAMIPVIAVGENGDTSNSVTIVGEFTSGKGDADEFTGFTGNLSQLPNGTTGSQSATNMDAGQGGFDSGGNFQLLKLQSWNAQIQYHFPVDWHMFATAGYSNLSASNINGLTPTSKVLYDKSSIYFVNLFKDLTKQIRVAVEYGKLTTHYVDSVNASDERYQVSAYFRF